MVSSTLLFNQLILLVVILLNVIIFLMLLRKYFKRKNKIPLYLAFVDFFIILPTVFAYISLIMEAKGMELNQNFNGLASAFVGFGNLFLFLAIYEIFQKPSRISKFP
ncbi:hypothetical protein [Candidatus Harpocratesius sp.]